MKKKELAPERHQNNDVDLDVDADDHGNGRKKIMFGMNDQIETK